MRMPGWNAPLQLALPVPKNCTAVGIRAHDFAPCSPDALNALPVKPLSSSENPFDWNFICTAPDHDTRLWWKVSKLTLSSPARLSVRRTGEHHAPDGLTPAKGRKVLAILKMQTKGQRSGYPERCPFLQYDLYSAVSSRMTYTPAGMHAAHAPSLSSQPNCSQI